MDIGVLEGVNARPDGQQCLDTRDWIVLDFVSRMFRVPLECSCFPLPYELGEAA